MILVIRALGKKRKPESFLIINMGEISEASNLVQANKTLLGNKIDDEENRQSRILILNPGLSLNLRVHFAHLLIGFPNLQFEDLPIYYGPYCGITS
jgi:hypothetical protein